MEEEDGDLDAEIEKGRSEDDLDLDSGEDSYGNEDAEEKLDRFLDEKDEEEEARDDLIIPSDLEGDDDNEYGDES